MASEFPSRQKRAMILQKKNPRIRIYSNLNLNERFVGLFPSSENLHAVRNNVSDLRIYATL